MSDALIPVLTRVGLAALARAQGDGLQAVIDRVAIGRGLNVATSFVGYTPDKGATALRNETTRVPILAGARLDPAGFRILAQIPAQAAPTDYFVREVGFFLATGELFALWSSPTVPLVFKSGLADVDLSFDLLLDQIPVGSLAISVLDPDIPDTTGVLAALLAVAARGFIGDINHRWTFPLKP